MAAKTAGLQESMKGADSGAPVGSRRYRLAFWVVTFGFLMVMAMGLVPSPLYGLYRVRDHFSAFIVTVAFAVYAVGVVGALLLAGHTSDLYGRRRLLLPAIGLSIISVCVFLASKSLPGLLVGRLITGISIGIAAPTATAYLAELHKAGRPKASPRMAQLAASAGTPGGLALGALVAGILAQWVAYPLTVTYFVFLGALVIAAIGVALSPETRVAAKPAPRYRPQRLSIPSAERGRYFAAVLSTFVGFAGNGLFAGLAGLFLAVTLHHPSLALIGGVLCGMFGAAAAAQFLTITWSITRDLKAGMAVMVIGVGLAVLGVWLHSPSLALFIAGGVLIGAGSGAIFKGAIGTAASISPPERTAESVTGVFVSAFVGISLPVVGCGIALSRGVTPKVTILVFAIVVTACIALAAIELFGRATKHVSAAPTTNRSQTHVSA